MCKVFGLVELRLPYWSAEEAVYKQGNIVISGTDKYCEGNLKSLGWDEVVREEVGFRSYGFSKEETFEQKSECKNAKSVKIWEKNIPCRDESKYRALRKKELGSSGFVNNYKELQSLFCM